MFICDRCGVVKEEAAEGVEDIMHTLAAKMGFALRHNVIEAHGCVPRAWRWKPVAIRTRVSTTTLFW
jgi:Fe2+ or Zn2+ uptake regulation protein